MAKKKKTKSIKKKSKGRRAAHEKKTGRPTKFNEDMIRQAELLGIKGFTDKEIARLFNVTEQTVNNWKIQFPQFFESLKKGKEIADSMVERSLFERACGYSHPDVHISSYEGNITVTNIVKHYPPDPTSAIFWLKNRKPKEWKDRQEQIHDVGDRLSGLISKIRQNRDTLPKYEDRMRTTRKGARKKPG